MKRGSKHSAEAKAKMSATRKGHAYSTGYRFTDEQRANVSAGLLKRWRENPPRPVLSLEEKSARSKSREASKRMLRRVLTMARRRKDASTEALLGYSKRELRAHLEARFKPGMSWAARESFHIDHIIPAKWFFDRGIFDPARINALSNLQPLYPLENRKKHSSYQEGIA